MIFFNYLHMLLVFDSWGQDYSVLKKQKYKKIIDLPIDFFSAGIYIIHTTCESNAGMVELVDTLA